VDTVAAWRRHGAEFPRRVPWGEYDFGHWAERPTVSCQCITWGRHEMLEEAIESFLRQDYPGKIELVIVSDQPGATLELETEDPRIRVVHLDERCASVGEKRNVCVGHCTGDLVMPWDDDDIHLPWRISLAVQQMRNHRHWGCAEYWTLEGDRMRRDPVTNPAPSNCIFARCAWQKVGGYPSIDSGQDKGLVERLAAQGWRHVEHVHRRDVPYVYRWGCGSYNLSASGYKNATGAPPLQPGHYVLRPHWTQDWVQEVPR